MKKPFAPLLALVTSTFLLAALAQACGSTQSDYYTDPPSRKDGGRAQSGEAGGTGDDDSSTGNFGPELDSGKQYGEAGGGCSGLQCQIHACSGGGKTTISGRVFDPAGRNPLYNVVVYVPISNKHLDPLPLGISANSCSCSALFDGTPIASALTDANGTFSIANAPDGAQIPLVVQIGKWRKQITIPNVASCQDNAQGTITLPKNSSEGDIPNIAIATGAADTLECLLRRVGVDESEYVGGGGTQGRIHIFEGPAIPDPLLGTTIPSPTMPNAPPSKDGLWNADSSLTPYDIVLMSCEGQPTTSPNPSALANYVNAGGRVFAEHFHYAWFANQSQFPNVADWNNVNATSSSYADSYRNTVYGVVQTTLASSGQPFPEGVALKAWLGNVGALVNNGELDIPKPNGRYNAVVTSSNVSTPWVITDQNANPTSAQYFSWDMPFNAAVNDAGVPNYCGRVVFSDLHVAGSSDLEQLPVPTGCQDRALSHDEDALEFILFDLSSCVTPVGFTPQPPPPNQPPVR